MRVHVRVPATSANLGPGFDALGLALTLHNEIVAEERDGVMVTIEGEGANRLARDAGNVVARGVKLAYEAAGRPFKGCALACVNGWYGTSSLPPDHQLRAASSRRNEPRSAPEVRG